MARKPAKMYRYIRSQATTRREYMGGVPPSRITQFVIGNKTMEFPVSLEMTANEKCQLRHTSLEAARISANKALEKNIGPANYRFVIRVYPHIVIRENKQATGAGADRVSQGMRRAYGKPVGTAARVKRNQVLMTIDTTQQFFLPAKEALRKAGMKLSTPCTISVAKGAELLH
ncbi:MAG TPA: 50S ribosomal protein L16 [Candidatus Thermoplasmatota archaeon]|nr:50S ribosomal protein L16 [Candidatus Thermoplasmatota archaeon]